VLQGMSHYLVPWNVRRSERRDVFHLRQMSLTIIIPLNERNSNYGGTF
jgi:hypothetical protein